MFSRFFENQPNEICSHLSEKASKGRFFGLDKLQIKITLTKKKERRKRKSEEEEMRRRETSNGCTLSFYNGYFNLKVVFGRKKTVGRKRSTSLAVTFSIRLDVHNLAL